jgi:aryl-alcohol dehydrogenase-like predicted oxidoreductase
MRVSIGKALKGISRGQYFLSTKVGKYTAPNGYGNDAFDFSSARIRASLEESAARLGTDYFDIIHLHDFEYEQGRHVESALDEGLATLQNLKCEGRIGAASCGVYPLELWRRILRDYEFDAVLVHNHYLLNETRLLELLPLAQQKNVGVINASPFGMGMLTERGPADWHPASDEVRNVFRSAAEFCRSQGADISELALQFASQHPEIPTTMFSSANAESIQRNVRWHEEPFDKALLQEVQRILTPVFNLQWVFESNTQIPK